MFVVCASFKIKHDRVGDFLPLVKANATSSLADEPGCHRFDVCQSNESPGDIFLYELYDDAAAFEAHKQTPHYAKFSEAVAEMLADKSVKTMTLRN